MTERSVASADGTTILYQTQVGTLWLSPVSTNTPQHVAGTLGSGVGQGRLSPDAGQVAAAPVLIGVAHLMRENGDVMMGAVEVGEDERNTFLGKRGAESTAGLALAIAQIKKTALVHQPEEIAELRPHPVEHRGRAFDKHVVSARRARIAGRSSRPSWISASRLR